MGREFELKYRAFPHQLEALAQGFGPFRQIQMETTYYDTPGRLLAARKWTFRRRLENGVSVCTLKTPDKKGGRGEWETECHQILSSTSELCKLGAPAELASLVSGGVEAVCGARFLRRACLISLPECTVELALDQGVLLGGGKELPLCEVEVELKAGAEEAAVAFAAALAAKFGLQPEGKSKFKRALELALAKER